MDHTPINSAFLPSAFSQRAVPVVFAANNGFVPMFAVCLQSLLEHSSPQYNYDVVLLQSDVTAENRAVLLGMTAGYPNVSLRFFDAAPLVADYGLRANAHISVETYYRFLIQAVLPAYDKVLYLDCDLILCADAAELYQEELDGYMLADKLTPRQFAELAGLDYEVAQMVYAAYGTKNEEYGEVANVSTYSVPLIDMMLFVCEQLDEGVVSLEAEQMDMLNSAQTQMEAAKKQLQGEDYNRVLVYLNLPEGGEETYAFLDTMRSIPKVISML